jgi:hypothetical protein
MTLHRHYEKFLILQKQFEEVGKEKVHEFWQIKFANSWIDCEEHDLLFDPSEDYRLKPKTRTLKSDIEYPEPILFKPVENMVVFLVLINGYERYESRWLNEICYKQGRVQATEEGAKQMLAALKNALRGE